MGKFLSISGTLALLSISVAVQATPQSVPSISTTQTGFNLDWLGHGDRTYFIQYSTDLSSWDYMPIIEYGQDTQLGYGFSASGDRLFLRLKYTDAPTSDALNDDFDHDGVSNYDEVKVGGTGTDPFAWDTDGDGQNDYFSDGDGNDVADGWEMKHYGGVGIVDPNADEDQDGQDATVESKLDTNPNAHADTNDEDSDGLVDSEDAVPDDELINWPRTPKPNYVYIELDELSGMENVTAVAMSENGHVLVKAWPTGSQQNGLNLLNFVWQPETATWSGPLNKVYNGTTGAYIEATDVGLNGNVVGRARVVDIDGNQIVHAAYESKCVWATASSVPQVLAGTRLAAIGETWDVQADASIIVPQFSPDNDELSMDYGRSSHAADGSGDPAEIRLAGDVLDDWWDPLDILPDPSIENIFGHPGMDERVPMYKEELTYNFETEEYEKNIIGSYLYQNGTSEQIDDGNIVTSVAQMPDQNGIFGTGRLAVTGSHTWIKKDGAWQQTKRRVSGVMVTSSGIIFTDSSDASNDLWLNGEYYSFEGLCPSLVAQNYTTKHITLLSI